MKVMRDNVTGSTIRVFDAEWASVCEQGADKQRFSLVPDENEDRHDAGESAG